jgi:hypothetical protein
MKRFFFLTILAAIFACSPAWAQNAETGALAGTVTDASGAALAGAKVVATNPATGAQKEITADATGGYRISNLPPGSYRVEVTAEGFRSQIYPQVNVNVTEVVTLNPTLQVGEQKQTITVEGGAELVQTESQTLGSVVGEQDVENLPLTNRNYTQILSFSPGVAGDVTDAAALGRNSQDVYVNGGRAIDNNYQMDGVEVNNFGTGRAGDWLGYTGIPIPNPDAIQEFKVQTGLFDAGYGKGVGANVEVVTKSGTNDIHGSLFEFFRNTVLNANDFFLNEAGDPRPVFKQNQFGFTLGGPAKKDKLFWFGSYQGTRQVSGEGASSLASSSLPPLTNDRSAAALGAEFCGPQLYKQTFAGGAQVACDGSNINPVALKLLNFKLPNGQYLIPTPQLIQQTANNGPVGLSIFSLPSTFTEDQYIANVDYVINSKNTLSGKFFGSRDPELLNFTYANTPGSGAQDNFQNRDFSVKLATTLRPTLLNEFRFGFTRNYGTLHTLTPDATTQIGMIPADPDVDTLPVIDVNGLFNLGGGWNDGFVTATNTFVLSDQVSWTHGHHTIRAGVEMDRVQYNYDLPGGHRGTITFQSFPDFLVGESAAQNGSPTGYSNLFSSGAIEGITDRQFRIRDWSSFVQEDWKVTPNLTVNLGLRWEIFGGLSEKRGYLSDFWPQLASNDFGANGTFSGFMVASNYNQAKNGTLPNGVYISNNNTCCLNPTPLGDLGPRVGLAWTPFKRTSRVVVRAGYGIFYSQTGGNMLLQLVTMYPFASSNFNTGTGNSLATFQEPFNPVPPLPSKFPIWVPRTETSNFSFEWLLPNWNPPMTQSWSLNTQFEVAKDWLAQVGYVGTRGERLVGFRQINQAYLASPSNPVNGITTNTVANAQFRVPVLGVAPYADGPETYGFSWYNALQASMTKRFSKGFTLQGSYTWDKTLDSYAQTTGMNSVWGGFAVNSPRVPRAGWGPADFDRPNRFIFNYVWEIPGPKSDSKLIRAAARGWSVSGVTTIQAGHRLAIYDANSGNIYGSSNNLAEICPGMTASNLVTHGSVQRRLSNYFNPAAVADTLSSPAGCSLPKIGDGFGFGDLGRGQVGGPDQNNYDISLAKRTSVWGFREGANLEFRAEFYNAFNHPQFADPATNVSYANYGFITSTTVAPRLIQFGLKYNF